MAIPVGPAEGHIVPFPAVALQEHTTLLPLPSLLKSIFLEPPCTFLQPRAKAELFIPCFCSATAHLLYGPLLP